MSVLRGLLLENMGLKLIALLLALVVYLHVYTDRPATLIWTFPVEVADVADSLAIVSQTPTTVSAELKGTGKQLIRLRLAEPRLRVSLAGASPGRFQRALTAQDLPLVTQIGLEVSHFIGPQMLELQLDRVIERDVPVAARIEGTLPAGSTWSGAWFADPPHAHLRGPHAALARLDSLRLQPVRLVAGHDTLRVTVIAASLPVGCEMMPTGIRLRVPITRAGR